MANNASNKHSVLSYPVRVQHLYSAYATVQSLINITFQNGGRNKSSSLLNNRNNSLCLRFDVDFNNQNPVRLVVSPNSLKKKWP